MSMISELVDKLRSIASSEWFYDDKFPSERAKIIMNAANTIEELSAKLHNSQMEQSSQRYNGGWIPCSERLPEENTRVLTTIKINKRPANVRSGYYAYKMFHNDNGDCWNCDDKEVIAWMPLPTSYQGEENCKWIPMSEQYKNKQSNCNKMPLPEPYNGGEAEND